MALTLQVRDLGNGLGAKVKVTGTPTSGVQIYRATVTVSGIGAYSVVQTPVVIGTEYTVAGTGYYWWKATDGSVTSNIEYQATSDGDTYGSDPWSRSITMIQDRIEALDLDWTWLGGVEGVPIVHYYFSPKSDEDSSPLNIPSPCVLLTIAGEIETIEDKTNQQDDIIYPVVISIVEKKHQNPESNRGRILWHRWRIHRALHDQQWDYRVPECWRIRVRPAQVLHTSWLEQAAVRWSLMTALCICREVRRPPETWE